MKHLLGLHLNTHFSLSTVTVTPAPTSLLSVNITAVHVPISFQVYRGSAEGTEHCPSLSESLQLYLTLE